MIAFSFSDAAILLVSTENRDLAGPDFSSMRRGLVLYFQPFRFARIDSESVNRGLPVLKPARGLDPWC